MGTRWMQTHRRHAYDLDREPDPWSIDLEDVAFALAHLNRYNGHAGNYSVAQHSVLALRAARSMGTGVAAQRAALMHDAHEAYTGDCPSPIKRVLGEAWERFEAMHARAVRRRFAIPSAMPMIVGSIDLRLLISERRDLLGDHQTRPWEIDVEPLTHEIGKITRWSADRARLEFLSACASLEIG